MWNLATIKQQLWKFRRTLVSAFPFKSCNSATIYIIILRVLLISLCELLQVVYLTGAELTVKTEIHISGNTWQCVAILVSLDFRTTLILKRAKSEINFALSLKCWCHFSAFLRLVRNSFVTSSESRMSSEVQCCLSAMPIPMHFMESCNLLFHQLVHVIIGNNSKFVNYSTFSLILALRSV